MKVRPDGTVKVLDFGLAKAMEPVGAASPGMSQLPTITTPAMTQAGVILGTAAYMSPEQAKGRAAECRSYAIRSPPGARACRSNGRSIHTAAARTAATTVRSKGTTRSPVARSRRWHAPDRQIGLVTKGPMVVRDRDVLSELAKAAGCTVYMSIPTVDEDAWRLLEPGTAHPLPPPPGPVGGTTSAWRGH